MTAFTFSQGAFAENGTALKALAALAREQKVQSQFQEALHSFVAEREFSGGLISIYKNGQLILDEGFGSASDPEVFYPIASVSKVFTEMAILKLASMGEINLNVPFYAYLGRTDEVRDSRIKKITIRQLLEHTGGWDRAITQDPLFALDLLFADSRTVSQEELVHQVLTQLKLDHAPGKERAYCNFGYLLLGAVIEKATGMSYLDYVNRTFAAPLGIELQQAETTHDAFSMELSTPSFGLAAKGSDLARLFSSYDRTGLRKRSPEDWSYDGSLPGTVSSVVVKRPNNTVIVVIIPDRNEKSWMADNKALRDLLLKTAKAVGL